eukprot:TRINITY_DN64615_c0_g1_i1.p1 TRINITY_DN64615_c0_g1~~TRINITY_DN64615_c0_g1_i1.p1  ORF type:complete len:264 (-),score=14.50 TRINITY_DN64615_c0_g1_i1:141-932(-)
MTKCAVCDNRGHLLDDVCPLCDGIPGWPEVIPSIFEMNVNQELRCKGLHREIRAIHDSSTVRVYQAYNAEIADAAVAANSFRAPHKAGLWSATRISWIKPSAVWMAYRCGWSVLKDKNQARVLALDVSRSGLEHLLMRARVSDDSKPGECKEYPVVVQWDPERFMAPDANRQKDALTTDVRPMRSIQIGLKGSAIANETFLNPDFVRRITDVTQSFHRAHQALIACPPDIRAAAAELWPDQQEELMVVPIPLRLVLNMDKPRH